MPPPLTYNKNQAKEKHYFTNNIATTQREKLNIANPFSYKKKILARKYSSFSIFQIIVTISSSPMA